MSVATSVRRVPLDTLCDEITEAIWRHVKSYNVPAVVGRLIAVDSFNHLSIRHAVSGDSSRARGH